MYDTYTPEMRAARKSKILTGLPDTYGRGRIAVRYRVDKSSLTEACCDVSGAKNNKSNGEIADGHPGTVFWEPIRGMRMIVR